ncbi:MAG: LysR family glycine cleavage system transcriptional activator [Parasphingorhabdus sp.]|jgi:LysR family glycine cleavage system transcriptional activator
MKRRLPPLNSLRAFEAAAQRLNFTRAAEDLSVTSTAISHQIRQLEQWFGVSLFQRDKRQMSLTEAGAQLYPVISRALDNLSAVSSQIRSAPERSTLTVSVTPTFGTRWLASRLGKFFNDHPEIDLRIHHSVHSVDFEREDVDLAIRWGVGPWQNTVAEWLIDADTVPMCSPKLLHVAHPLNQPTDLRHHVLLHDENHQEWTEWLIGAGLDDIDGNRGPVLGDANSMVRAAMEGLGVFLGTETMMSAELENGSLVQPFDLTGKQHPAYFLVYPAPAVHMPKVQAFRDFVLGESVPD